MRISVELLLEMTIFEAVEESKKVNDSFTERKEFRIVGKIFRKVLPGYFSKMFTFHIA